MNLKSRIDNQEVYISELEKKCKQYEEKYYSMVENINAREERYKEYISAQQEEIKKLKTEKAEIEQSLTDANQELSLKLQTCTREAEEKERELNDIINSLKTAVKQKDSQLDKLKTELNDVKQDYQQQNTQLSAEQEKGAALVGQLKTAEQQLKEKAEQIAALKDEAESSRTITVELKDNIKQLEQKIKSQAKEIDKVAALQKQVKELQGQLRSLEQIETKFDPELNDIKAELEKTLADNIQAKNVWLEESKKGLTLSILSDELFEPGSVILGDTAKSLLREIAEVLKNYSGREILVEGHTDNQPLNQLPFYDNWALASARANNVVRYFIEELQMTGKQFKSSSASQYHPITSNESLEGRKKNRRVVIIITSKP